MSQLLSGWISIDGRTIYPGDLVHHERGAEIHGISEAVACQWEWTEKKRIDVRVSPAAKKSGATAAWYRQLLRDRFSTRDAAIKWCVANLSPHVTSLNLIGCTGITELPKLSNVTWLNLAGCTGITKLPELSNVTSLNLAGCTGITKLPELPNVRTLFLRGCKPELAESVRNRRRDVDIYPRCY